MRDLEPGLFSRKLYLVLRCCYGASRVQGQLLLIWLGRIKEDLYSLAPLVRLYPCKYHINSNCLWTSALSHVSRRGVPASHSRCFTQDRPRNRTRAGFSVFSCCLHCERGANSSQMRQRGGSDLPAYAYIYIYLSTDQVVMTPY